MRQQRLIRFPAHTPSPHATQQSGNIDHRGDQAAPGNGINDYIAMQAGNAGQNRQAWFHNDERGTLIAMTDQAGAVLNRFAPDGFGVYRSFENFNYFPEYGLTSKFGDDGTGLLYFGARWYDVQTGRWVSHEPLGYAAGGMNLYAFNFNNPYKFVDPDGYHPLGAGVAIAVGGASAVADTLASAAALAAAAMGVCELIDLWNNTPEAPPYVPPCYPFIPGLPRWIEEKGYSNTANIIPESFNLPLFNKDENLPNKEKMAEGDITKHNRKAIDTLEPVSKPV